MLSKKEIQNLKGKLEKEQAELVAELNGLKKPEAIDMGTYVDDYTDGEHTSEEGADKDEELVTNLSIAQPLNERLEGIKATLFKIEQGKYGFCEKCGSEIDKEVLDVDPESRWCRNCKLQDQKNKT